MTDADEVLADCEWWRKLAKWLWWSMPYFAGVTGLVKRDAFLLGCSAFLLAVRNDQTLEGKGSG